MAADEAVDAENQHALFAAGRAEAPGVAVPLHSGNDPAFRRQLGTGLEDVAVELCGENLDRSLAAGDDQRIGRYDRSGGHPVVGVEHFCRPDEALAVAEETEGAGVGSGHGTDKIIDLFRTLVPVDLSVFGTAAVEHCRVGFALGRPRGLAVAEQGKGPVQHFLRGGNGLVEDAFGRVAGGDLKAFLSDDVARVGLFGHVVERDTRLLFPVDDGPVDGNPAPVFGQKRTVEIDASLCRDAQQLAFDEGSVVETEDEVGRERLDAVDPHGVIDIFGSKRGDAVTRSALRDRVEPDVFTGIVAVSEHRADLETRFEQSLYSGAAHVVISQYDALHSQTPVLLCELIKNMTMCFPDRNRKTFRPDPGPNRRG